MKLMSILLSSFVFLIGGAVSQANAYIVADLGGSRDIARQMDFSVDGVNFYATASSGNSTSWVYQSREGLGVSSTLFEAIKQIDGTGRDDMLWLTFETPVTLLSATFSRAGLNDNFVLLGEGFTPLLGAKIPDNNEYDFTGFSFTGTFFAFTVKERNDDYFLKQITFQPVPIPGTAVMLVSGMVGLMLIRRRRIG
jgi:hypothetical protein